MIKDFDLIIANPPYGKSCSVCKPIAKKLLKHTKDLILLTPDSMYKDDELRSKISNIQFYSADEFFDIWTGTKLAVSKLNKSVNNIISLIDFKLDNKGRKLIRAILRYNETHKSFNMINGSCFAKKMSIPLKDCNKKEEFPVELKDKTFKDCINENLIFLKPLHWNVASPKDLLNSKEGTYNVRGVWKDEWNYTHRCDAIIFKSKLERDNFRSWVYQEYDENWNRIEVEYGAFLNHCIRICLLNLGAASAEHFYIYLPHLDWTKTWTDQEVLKELGLPENFLEE